MIFKLSNPRTTILDAKNRFKVAIYDESYTLLFSINQYEVVVQRLRLFAVSRATMPRHGIYSSSTRVLELYAVPQTEPFSALTRALLHCSAPYHFVLLEFSQWRSRADRVLTLSMNIKLSLFCQFWSTWSRALGPDSAACAGLAHGQ